MDITDVRIKLVQNSPERLKAFCTITFDGEFVVRDIKLVDGVHGLFVAMPSRKVTNPCPECRHKNHLRARFCEDCGKQLPPYSPPPSEDGRNKLYTDVAHPITPAFREKLQLCVVEAFEAAVKDAETTEDVRSHEEESVDVSQEEESVDVSHEERPPKAAKGDDYSSLIADLKGGRGDQHRDAPEDGGRSRPPERKRHRGGGGGQGGRERSSGRKSEPAVDRSDRRESPKEPQGPSPAEVAVTFRNPKEEEPDEAPERATVVAEAAVEKEDLVSVDEASTEQSATQGDLEDTGAFGVGIN